MEGVQIYSDVHPLKESVYRMRWFLILERRIHKQRNKKVLSTEVGAFPLRRAQWLGTQITDGAGAGFITSEGSSTFMVL